jgi:CubicO group peptidase (beta-lactamase class C family)
MQQKRDGRIVSTAKPHAGDARAAGGRASLFPHGARAGGAATALGGLGERAARQEGMFHLCPQDLAVEGFLPAPANFGRTKARPRRRSGRVAGRVAVPPGSDAFEAWARAVLDEARVPGMAVAVAEDGRLSAMHGFGARDREAGLAITPDTVFGIGSVTKSFTAVAILQLQERGLLSVDDPVARHLPELRVPNVDGPEAMRLHHLLTHTAGLPPLATLMPAMLTSLRADPGVAADMGLPEGRLEGAEAIDTPDQMIAYLNRTEIRPLGSPGAVFSYSNDGYALLGEIVHRASGEAYEAYVRGHILEPAGMARSTIDLGRLGDDPDIAVLYARRRKTEGQMQGDVVRSPLWWQSSAMAPAGFLRSSATDLLRYLEIFRTGGSAHGVRILSAESVRAMTARHVQCDLGSYYGYGLFTTPDHGGATLVGHGGSVKGVAAEIMLVPERGLSAVGLANLAGAPTGRLVVGALNARLGLDLEAPRVSLPDVPGVDDLEIAGVYAADEGGRAQVHLEDGAVSVEMQGQRHAARRVGERAYAVSLGGRDMVLRFITLSDGETAVQSGFRVLRKAAAAGAAG